VVFGVDTEPVSRYDDFSQTEALITAGRENAELVLRFWESGGVGEDVGAETAGPIDALAPAADEAV
jgi:hypothetical protein